MKSGYSRAMISAELNGTLTGAPVETNPIFGLAVPTTCPDVPAEVLNPRNTWTKKATYDARETKLAKMLAENFAGGGSGRGTSGVRRPVATPL